MPGYFINQERQPNGDHEIHHEDCSELPPSWDRLYLGEYPCCLGALLEAEKHFSQCKACSRCSGECGRAERG